MTEEQKTDVENAIKSINIDFDSVAEEMNKDIVKQKEELEQKAEEWIEEYAKDKGTMEYSHWELSEMLFKFATEVTKKLQMPCNSCHLPLPQTLVDKNKELQEENKQAKGIIRELLKWEQDRGITDNLFDKDPKLKSKAEAFLKE